MLVLENRPRVVIESADQLGIERVGDFLRRQPFLDHPERFGAGRAEVIDDMRRLALQRLVLRILGIEEAQRVLLEACAALFAQLGKVRSIVLTQQLAVGGAADFVADAVQVQAHPSNLQLGKPIPADHDGLHVDHRAAIPNGFDDELVELPKASCLGPVIPEIRTGVEEPNRLRFLVEPGVEVRPHDGGGSLRP